MAENGNGKARYDGETVRVGDREFVIPSISVKQTRELWPKMMELSKGVTAAELPEKVAIAAVLIHAALSRNYPEITLDEVEDLVDLRNFRPLMLAVSGQAGLKPSPGAEPAAAGPSPVSSTGSESTAQ